MNTPASLTLPQTQSAASSIARAAASDAPRPDTSADGQAYTAPRLVLYGGLAHITAKVGSRGKKDMSGNRRTGF